MFTSLVHSQVSLLSPPEPHFLIINVQCTFILQKGIFYHFLSELKGGPPLGHSSFSSTALMQSSFGSPKPHLK